MPSKVTRRRFADFTGVHNTYRTPWSDESLQGALQLGSEPLQLGAEVTGKNTDANDGVVVRVVVVSVTVIVRVVTVKVVVVVAVGVDGLVKVDDGDDERVVVAVVAGDRVADGEDGHHVARPPEHCPQLCCD